MACIVGPVTVAPSTGWTILSDSRCASVRRHRRWRAGRTKLAPQPQNRGGRSCLTCLVGTSCRRTGHLPATLNSTPRLPPPNRTTHRSRAERQRRRVEPEDRRTCTRVVRIRRRRRARVRAFGACTRRVFFIAIVDRKDCINCGSCEPSYTDPAISAGRRSISSTASAARSAVGASRSPQSVGACPIEAASRPTRRPGVARRALRAVPAASSGLARCRRAPNQNPPGARRSRRARSIATPAARSSLRRRDGRAARPVRHASRRVNIGSGFGGVGRPVAARLRHLHEARAQRQRRMAGEVA